MNRIGERVASDGHELTRRHFLSGVGLGLGSLVCGPGSLLAGRGAQAEPERSVILLLLVGGPSQLETWDPKPDAPAEVRGPFGSIATRCPGVRVSEHLPRMAAGLDRLALVRSVHHDSAPIHEAGYQMLQTGRLCPTRDEQPHIGSVVARLEGARNGVAPFVVLPGPIAGTGVDIPRGQTAGWLGSAYEPFTLPADPAGARFVPARAIHGKNDGDYGETAFGENCRRAVALVDAGARLVTVNMADTVFNRVSWDCHGAVPFSSLDDYARRLLPTFDQAFIALLDDLERRGRLGTTLVVAAGEFGRTPRLNASGGRDHWPGVWSVVLAGGGVSGGQVVGASDAHAAEPADRPVTPQDLLATMYHSLGIDGATCLGRPGGAPYPLVEGGSVIRELFG